METTPHDNADVHDVIVVGAGPVGQTVLERARAAGLSVALVERELVGGECSYWACIPSKALLRPVVAVADARRVEGASAAVTGTVDPRGAFARRDRVVADWNDSGQADNMTALGATLVRGHGRLVGERRVAVEGPDGAQHMMEARHAVVVCTGSGAFIPDLPGIEEARPWNNRRATDSEQVPGSLVVIGGGGVAVEMASAWQGLGARVTLLARGFALLSRMEPFVGEEVAHGLAESGVDVRTNTDVVSLSRPDPDGPVTVRLAGGAELEADEVLFATGRTPHTDDIGLDTVGLAPGTWLDIDDACRVRGVDGGWLYAAGDVNHHALLTHQGKYQARIAGEAIGALARGESLDTAVWGAHATTADFQAVPQVFFCDPEAASVGLTAAEAERAGHRTKVVDVDMGAVPGAYLYADGYRGRARMVVDLDGHHLLGVTFVGPGVAELLHSATVAVAGGITMDRLWHAVPCFPTISEVWLHLMKAYRD
ncbi:dihydrolipoyl dehydrogenase family protein [Streptomyces sp. NBC_01462]|uniref:dihydrolipoyl dehydrogenase family protein n=1 Tax=Streptomyces sp. NBC_01462 TaxID=2903876 RepID=UPI002E2F0818|nr:NAD(P)/FAD-dependent oxidoreductase [Streptomyces sp. NBC_01462]